MVELEILKMLKKISSQLDEISDYQKSLKGDILDLSEELQSFQEFTLEYLNARFPHEKEDLLLN